MAPHWPWCCHRDLSLGDRRVGHPRPSVDRLGQHLLGFLGGVAPNPSGSRWVPLPPALPKIVPCVHPCPIYPTGRNRGAPSPPWWGQVTSLQVTPTHRRRAATPECHPWMWGHFRGSPKGVAGGEARPPACHQQARGDICHACTEGGDSGDARGSPWRGRGVAVAGGGGHGREREGGRRLLLSSLITTLVFCGVCCELPVPSSAFIRRALGPEPAPCQAAGLAGGSACKG